MSGKHSVEALRRFKEENPHMKDADLQAWIAPADNGQVMKISLSKKAKELLKAFGLNPQASQRKHTQGSHTGKGRVNIAQQAGAGIKGAGASPQAAAAAPMGKTKKKKIKIKKVNAAPVVSPSNPKTVTPKIDTPKASMGKTKDKKKVKKMVDLGTTSRTTDSGQGSLEA
jgi:hypothetical protein